MKKNQMKKLKLNSSLLLAISLLATGCDSGVGTSLGGDLFASRGADSSGGSDLHSPEDKAAWFSGNQKTIQVCYEVNSQSFPQSLQVEEQIKKAFAAWKTYSEEKLKNYSLASTATDSNPEASRQRKLDQEMHHLIFDTSIRSAPEGGCAALHPDLTFYFGVSNPAVQREIPDHKAPVGFAVRTQFDRLSGWGRGFVWLNNDSFYWQDSLAVYGVLLHELGHVYGCDHVSGTIMDADIAFNFNSTLNKGVSPEQRQVYLSKIDQSRELVTGSEFDYRLNSYTALEDHSPKTLPVLTLFKQLMGRDMNGDLQLRVHQDAVMPQSFTLTVGDDKDQQEFSIQNLETLNFKSDTRAFNLVWATRQEESSGSFLDTFHGGFSSAGAIQIVRGTLGKDLQLELIWNEGRGENHYPEFGGSFSPVRLNIKHLSGGYPNSVSVFMQSANWL